MSTRISDLIPQVRHHLIEETGTSNPYWSDQELTDISIRGIKDLWRSITDLKQEHYCTIDRDHVVLNSGDDKLSGVPQDVHKIYMIEPRDLSENGSNHGLLFKPLPYNNNTFQLARSKAPIDPLNDTIYYALRGAGSPATLTVVDIAPKVTATVQIAFTYIPTLPVLTGADQVPIPGEADQALIAWTVAFARAKERDDRSPDTAWIQVYSVEKGSLLQSLGLRQYQEPSYVEAEFMEYW